MSVQCAMCMHPFEVWAVATVGANRGLIRGSYIEIFSPKKTGFSPVKNTSQYFFDFCLPLFYATFQCGPYNIFKKNLY